MSSSDQELRQTLAAHGFNFEKVALNLSDLDPAESICSACHLCDQTSNPADYLTFIFRLWREAVGERQAITHLRAGIVRNRSKGGPIVVVSKFYSVFDGGIPTKDAVVTDLLDLLKLRRSRANFTWAVIRRKAISWTRPPANG